MILEIFSAVIISAGLTFFGSKWIDFLYKMQNSPLSFPEEILSRSKFRKYFLAIIFFVCAVILIKLPPQQFFFMMSAVFFLGLITCTDFEQYVIFDRMILPFAVVGILAAISLNFPLTDRIIAAVVGGGIFLLIAILTKGGIGGGDIKLVAVLGIWLGCEKLLNVVLFSCIFAGICAVILILANKKDRRDFFAYGPYFTLTAIFFVCFRN
ncbi:MAG: prepilin peptidase [Selenomonadaceae bacterium]|nr:prepilin peptidase [Selenomonadaceae bacterium]